MSRSIFEVVALFNVFGVHQRTGGRLQSELMADLSRTNQSPELMISLRQGLFLPKAPIQLGSMSQNARSQWMLVKGIGGPEGRLIYRFNICCDAVPAC